MRELRPLILPERLSASAQRNSNPNPQRYSGPYDGAAIPGTPNPQCDGAPSWESLASELSECSPPLTPTFSRGHSRMPSTASSLSSTSPSTEHLEGSAVRAPKLTQLREDPWEGDVPYDLTEPSETLSRSSIIYANADLDFSDSFLNDDVDIPASTSAKRHRSGDSTLDQVVNRLGTRFTRRRRNTAQGQFSYSCAPSTRSSSLTGSVRSNLEQGDYFPNLDPQYIEACSEHSFDAERPRRANTPAEITIPDRSVTEPIDRERLAATPLLPPCLNNLGHDNEDVPSPLQSPTVADPATAPVSMAFAPSMEALPLSVISLDTTYTSSPVLSTRPSFASIQPSTQPSPLLISHPRDAWSTRLGHANFTIEPEPYLPDAFTSQSYRDFVKDWSTARGNYTRHQVRTADHFGPTSKVFQLTEQKWTEVDAEWRRHWETVRRGVAKTSVASSHSSSSSLDATTEKHAGVLVHAAELFEPETLVPADLSPPECAATPTMPLPNVSAEEAAGKFPRRGDEDIVGPMERVQAPCGADVAIEARRRWWQLWAGWRAVRHWRR